MIENISILISFIALLIGIIGNTWDNKKKGIRKVTRTGWLTISIGLVTCSIAIYKNIQKQEQLNWQENQKQKIVKIAYSELENTIENLLWPFGILYENTCFDEQYQFNDSCQIEKFYKNDNYRFSQLTNPRFLSQFDSIDLKKTPTYPDIYPNALWWELFSENAQRNQIKLNELWLKHNLYIDTETILKINSILNDDFFRMRLVDLKTLVEANNHKSEYYMSWVFIKGPDEGKKYYEYLDKLKDIKETTNEYASR